MKLLRESPVVTLEGLLERLYFPWSSRKCTAELHYLPNSALCWVHEVWAGRESEGTEEATEVNEAVVVDALHQELIVGRPKWGHTSKVQFILSELGRKTYEKLRSDREASKHPKPEVDTSSNA